MTNPTYKIRKLPNRGFDDRFVAVVNWNGMNGQEKTTRYGEYDSKEKAIFWAEQHVSNFLENLAAVNA